MGMKIACEACGTPVIEGFVVNGGDAYYCSTECLRTRYTEAEWAALNGEGAEYNEEEEAIC